VGKWKLRFKFNPGTTIYLQTNASWYGDVLSSMILSCDISKDEAMDRASKMVRFVEAKKTEKPVRWKDVMERRQLFDESYDDEQAGDLLRDNCKEVRSIELNGGFLFGGPDGTKYSHLPSINVTSSDDDAMSKWNRPSITVLCKFSGKHDCKMELHKDASDKLSQMQDMMKGVFLRQEMKKWDGNPSKKAKDMIDKAAELLGTK
jgi:hypothetical protein